MTSLASSAADPHGPDPFTAGKDKTEEEPHVGEGEEDQSEGSQGEVAPNVGEVITAVLATS